MCITIHASIPHDGPDASRAVGPADQPGTSIVQEPPVADPGMTDDERRTKGLDGTFARPRASGAEIVQEPTGQQCAGRDPAGSLVRVQELR